MPKHWLLDREDPRTVLLLYVLILVVGLVVTVDLIRSGGWGSLIGVSWTIVSVWQVTLAAAKFHRWRQSRDK